MIHVRVGIHPSTPPPDRSAPAPVDVAHDEPSEDDAEESKPEPKQKPKK